MITEKLKDWLNDASSYELLNTYKIEQQVLYPFVNNGEDFYIALLNRLFFTIREESIDVESTKEELLQVVKGLMLYSDDNTAENFKGVNRHNNLLYIAAIYFLCEYYALSHLFMWKARRYNYGNESAQLLYSILAGSKKYSSQGVPLCLLLDTFMDTGDGRALDEIEGRLNQKVSENSYEGLDDFFDTHIVISVLKRFKANNIWKDLMPYGGEKLWKNYITYSVRQHIYSLLPSQEDAIRKGALAFNRSFSLKMPTSAGKTFLTELLVYQEIMRNPEAKILYLAPLRSLSRELKERYGSLSREFNFDFRAAYGGCTTTAEEETIENAKLLIATPETFTTLEGSIEDLTSNYTLVICDEGQLLEDKTRGANYELLLTRLKRNPQTRFLFISAIIPNISEINTWLGGSVEEIGDSQYRPCKIRFAIAQNNNGHANVQYANEAINDFTVAVDDFLNEKQLQSLKTSHKSFSCAIALKAMDAGPVMLYCSMKDGNMGCVAHAEESMRLLGGRAFRKPVSYIEDTEWLNKAIEYCAYQLGDDYRLTNCLKLGMAYHHGQMPQDLRELIEMSIGKRTIQLVVCTKTLSEGINMPIKTAVLGNITNPADGSFTKPLDLRDLKNIVGRVGRAGKERYGMIIVPVKENVKPARKVISVLKGEEVERANGSLYYVVKEILDKSLSTEEEINNYLESEGVAEAIDTLIKLNKENVELDELNLDDVIEDSLAYYLADEDLKQEVRRVFRIRYKYITETLTKEEYGKFLLYGLPLTDYKELKEVLADKTAEDFAFDNALDGGWIHLMIETVYSMSSVKRDVERLSKTKPLFTVHNDTGVKERLLVEWLSGQQYVEMAAHTGCTVEQATLYVDFLQKTVAVKVQAIVAYIKETFGVENPLMDIWSDMVKRGVSDERALFLIDSGLGERILVNFLADFGKENFPLVDEKDEFEDEIIHSRLVDEYVMNLQIPVLLKERWKQYLRSKGMMYE